MKAVRIYTGDDSQSHFEEIEITQTEVPFGNRSVGEQRSSLIPAEGVIFRVTPQTIEGEFHPAPRRQFVVTLAGVGEIECGDGTKRRFGPGDIMLADDTMGQGHITRTVEGPRRSIMIPLPPTADISQWRA